MNAIVKKAFEKMAELPEPVQESVARGLLDKISKWQSLRREVSAGFASGAAAAWDKDEIKAAGRRRLAARRAKK